MAKGKEVSVKKDNLPSTELNPFEGMGMTADSGFEEMTSRDRIVPFLRVLQSGSAQVKKAKPEFIEGASEGQLCIVSDKKVFDGDEGLYIIPVYYNTRWNEWGANRGGLKRVHDSETIMTQTQPKEENGKFKGNFLSNGNQIVEHRNLYAMVLDLSNNLLQPVIISAAGSQSKYMKQLTHILFSMRRNGIPLQNHMVKVLSTPQSNDEGDWYVMNFHRLGTLVDVTKEMELDWVLTETNLKDIKEFYDVCKSGAVKVE